MNPRAEQRLEAAREIAWATDLPDVVVFGTVPWGPRWHRPHHFVEQLVLLGHRVVYLTPHLLTGGEGWRLLEEETAPDGVVLAGLCTHGRDSIHTAGPWTHDDVAHAHHLFWQLADDLRLRCPILLVQSPAWWPVVSWLADRTDFPLVYDCIDEHTGWNLEAAASMRSLEEELARRADLVLASAPALHERMRELSPSALLVPNGCDADHFAAAAAPNGVLRPPLDGPIVGYVGAVSSGWFDTGLLVTLAEERPDWNFVLVGPADEEAQALLDPSPNVLQLGEVPYADLPRYLGDMDVAIIPFLVNDLTAATDPVKLYEYFAAGKPVVSTPLPAVYEFQGPLAIADTASAFGAAIEGLLREPGDGDVRRALAADASWARRVESFHAAMLGCVPSLDVVVLTHNNVALTRRCLDSLRADGSAAHRLVVVDNASTDGTVELLRELEESGRALVVRHETNLGFAAGVNSGIRAGAGRYVLILNNDTELPRGGLLALVNALARSTEVGLVGPVTNSIGNEAEVFVPYEPGDAASRDAWFRTLAWERFGRRFDVTVCALFAAILRREDLEAAGLVPERYQVGMFEDDELSVRIREHGKRVVCAEDAFVHHAGRAAFRTLDPVVYRAIFDRNRRVFENSTGVEWREHRHRRDKAQPVEDDSA